MRRRMDKFLPLPGASLAAKVSILVNVSILVASRAQGLDETRSRPSCLVSADAIGTLHVLWILSCALVLGAGD